MYLSKLEIFGFKSFPDKTTIEFDNGVAAIVGPNGSGKSNIVDALRWVLGEQGDKILRSEKREDVVFNGTSKRKPLSVAEVSLTIQNNKNILPTEYTEVQIARRFFRSGETEYYLNGTKVRLKDIKNLFIDTGMSPDAYSVIELKMVDAILSAVKNERRKLFEEAAGVVSYKYNRDLTIKRLDSVKENLTRVNDIIREKQRNVNAIERQVKRAEEAKIVFEDLKALETIVSNYEYKILNDEINEIKAHEHENISLKEKLNSEIKEYDDKYDALREENLQFEEVLEKINNELSSKKEKINEIERFNLVTEQKIDNYKNNIDRLSKENKNFETNIISNTDKLSELENKIKVLKSTIEISEISLQEKKINVDTTIKIINEKKEEIKSIGNKLKDANKIVNETRNKYQKNKLILENNLERLNNISENNKTDLTALKELENEKRELEKAKNTIFTELKKTENELNYFTKIKNELSDKITELDKSVNQKKLELQKKASRINHLEMLLDTFEDYAEGIKHLIKDKKFENIQTVIDSIEVEDKYKTAIETSLGEVSNYLIVDDSRELNKFIDALNSDDKGKVTFILNDKLNYRNPYIEYDFQRPDFINDKDVYGFADELVKCNKKEYSLLLKYLLDEYVVVENMETAFRLSKDNYYKFITLDGDIITESFIRAGGKVKEEYIKLGREKQIEKLISERNTFSDELSELESKFNLLNNDYDNIDISNYKNNFETLQNSSIKNDNDVSILNFKINEINKNLNYNEELYTKIQDENKGLNELINNLIENLSKSENQQSNLDKELSFLSDEFSEIEQNYTQYSNDFNSFNLEVLKLKNEFSNEESNLNRITNSIEFQKKQIQKNKLQIEEENKLLEDFELKIDINNEILLNLKVEAEKIVIEYNKQKDVLEQKREVQNRIDSERRGKRLTFDAVSQKLIASQIRIKENQIKSENVSNYLKKEYSLEIASDYNLIKSDECFGKFFSEYTNINGEFEIEKAKDSVDELSTKLQKLGGAYQQLVWDDFQSEKEALEKMIEQRNDLIESEKDIRKTIEKINAEARERFLKTFDEIRQNFIRIFIELFQEGDEANLKLVYEEDEDGKLIEDPLEAKIEITAKPRGKRPTSIELLSGGEKTLTAIALLFAIYLVKPSPFCVLDEVDAPLDVANLGRFNKMIRKFSENTQFILITHNERTMERVDRLYGVTMQEPGVTTIVETKFKNN